MVIRGVGNITGAITRLFGGASYSGEKVPGELSAMPQYGDNPNDFIESTYGVLSSRNATLYNTFAPARAVVSKGASYVIGDGVLFRSNPAWRYLEMDPSEAKEWGQKFTELLHYEKLASGYYEKQNRLYREAKITGDAVLYFVRDTEDGAPFDLVVAGGSVIDWTYTKKNTDGSGYTLGIKHDKYGRRLGFRTVSGGTVEFKDKNNDQNAVQFFRRERATQMRGYGAFYSEIAHAKNYDRYWDAILARAAAEASQFAVKKGDSTDLHSQALDIGRSVTAGSDLLVDSSPTAKAVQGLPGQVYQIGGDESYEITDLKAPGSNFATYNEWTIRHLAMATGYAPEFIRGEYNTSYTAHKGALNDTWKVLKAERAEFCRVVDNTVNLEYLKSFALAGKIEVPPSFWSDRRVQQAYLAGTHLGPVPGHINPLQEIKAHIEADNAGYALKSDIASLFNNNFHDMIEEWGEQQSQWADASPAQQQAAQPKQPTEDQQ